MLDRAAALLLGRGHVLVVLASLALLPACGKKPTTEQCEQYTAHFLKLLEESRDKPDSRVKQLARTYEDKIEQGIEAVGDLVDEKTGGKYAGQVDQAQKIANEQLDKVTGDQA